MTSEVTPRARGNRLKIGAIAVSVIALVGGATAAVIRSNDPAATSLATLLSGTEAQHAAHVAVRATGPGLSQSMDGYIDFVADRSSFVTTSGPRTETRSIGSDSWATVSPGQPAPAGKRWMHLPHQKGGGLLKGVDPHDIVDALARSGGRVVALGDTSLDGHDVRHYRVSDVPGKAKGVFEIFLDDDDLLRRMVLTGPLPGGATLTFQLDVLSYTAPVAIEAPPADEVFEFSDLAKVGSDTFCSMMRSQLAASHMTEAQQASQLADFCSSSTSRP